jgi:hypothetical protein
MAWYFTANKDGNNYDVECETWENAFNYRQKFLRRGHLVTEIRCDGCDSYIYPDYDGVSEDLGPPCNCMAQIVDRLERTNAAFGLVVMPLSQPTVPVLEVL